MKIQPSIFLLLAVPLTFSCVKQDQGPHAVTLVKGPIRYSDYRDKYTGTYAGPNTDWTFSMGVTTTWIADSNLVDEYTKVPFSDSTLQSKYFGTFTVSPSGRSSYSAWQSYRAFVFRNDSVIYTHSDWSALGGSYGNQYKAKKIKH